jgi:hypothetical protein
MSCVTTRTNNSNIFTDLHTLQIANANTDYVFNIRFAWQQCLTMHSKSLTADSDL